VLDKVAPDLHQINFDAENFIKHELRIKLDKDEQICRDNLSPEGCPLGPQNCPARHTSASPLNFQPPPTQPSGPRERERQSTVCKHWLRGLCKKGENCEFLHEYNLRRMPECWWFAKYGYCASGDECLYVHPKERKTECPDYKRGFCKLGPDCRRKHVRRVACQNYLTGFCPLGNSCPKAHLKMMLPTEADYRTPSPPPQRELGPPPPGHGRFVDYGRGAGRGVDGGLPLRRNLDEVLCFKCDLKGHYANSCKNKNVPGNRGTRADRRAYD